MEIRGEVPSKVVMVFHLEENRGDAYEGVLIGLKLIKAPERLMHVLAIAIVLKLTIYSNSANAEGSVLYFRQSCLR